MVSRRLVRLLVRAAILLTLITTIVFVSDLWYDFLPSSIQTRLPLHPPDPVIVDIQIRKCGLLTSCEISEPGWAILSKDLYLGRSWSQKAFVYTRSINENELPAGQEVVLGIAHGKFDLKDLHAQLPEDVLKDIKPEVGTGAGDAAAAANAEAELLKDRHAAFELATSHGWKLKDSSLGLWVKTGKHTPNFAVTAVNVLFGKNAQYPVPGWKLCSQALPIEGTTAGLEPRLAFRIGRPDTASRMAPDLAFSKSGKFKIAQLTDVHMVTGPGACDHAVSANGEGITKPEDCEADLRTMEFVRDILDSEKPDFVAYTGDLIFGDESYDPETALLKAFAPVLERKIPFAVVWGNHDNQGSLDNAGLMNIVRGLPYTVAQHGPDDLPGDGNYVTTVRPYNSDYPALSMVFLDSHGKLSAKGGAAYNYIRPEQHDFVRREMAGIRAKLHGYPHIPLSMAFFHIPLPEYRSNQAASDAPVRVGQQRENIIGPTYNSGTLQVLREQGISVVSVGHDHVNDFCQLQPPGDKDNAQENVWLCYGGAAGFGGYGGYPDNRGDYRRRIRIFDIDMNLPFIDTWHRVQDTPTRQNHVRLVDSGIARFGPGPEPPLE